jgi:flagellar basal-body rod protein FlgB
MHALLFDLASGKTSWLAARQAAVSANIANVNTAGYQPVDSRPFAELVDAGELTGTAQTIENVKRDSAGLSGGPLHKNWEVQQSGNSVSLEQEMLKAGAIQQDYALSIGITRSFHRMLLAAARG